MRTMATATATTVIVRFDPTATSMQADVIGAATQFGAGVMTAEQVQKLDKGGTAFQDVADGTDDFAITIPVGKRPASANYVVTMTIQSGTVFTLWRIPIADQTTSSFRVLTDGAFAAGTLLGFTITEF